MTRLLRASAGGLMLLFAAAWPWQAYMYVPGTGATVMAFAGGGLIVLWAANLVRTRRWGMPFEFTWIWVLLLGLAAFHAWATPDANSLHGISTLFVFAATFYSGRMLRDYSILLKASAISGALAALPAIACTGATPFPTGELAFRDVTMPFWVEPLGLLPTAYDIEAKTFLCGAYTVSGGVQAGVACAAIAAAYAMSGPVKPMRRVLTYLGLAGLILAGIAPAMVQSLPHWVAASGMHARFDSIPHVASSLLVLWGVCRGAAKIAVAWAEWRHFQHPIFLSALAAMTLTALWVPIEPDLWHGFLLGLAFASACPRLDPDRGAGYALPCRWPLWICAALLPLAVINMRHVFPGHAADPRNYDRAARQDVQAEAYSLLERRMSYFDYWAPGEKRTWYWRACGWLNQHEPLLAAGAFQDAMEEDAAGGQILPPPTGSQVRAFMNRLRDLSSSLPDPEKGVALEQALIAAGETQSALASLRNRLPRNTPEFSDTALSSAPLAQALASYLGTDELASELKAWDAASLLALFESIGAEIQAAPEGFPASQTPSVRMLQIYPHKALLAVYPDPERHKGPVNRVTRLRINPDRFGKTVLEHRWPPWAWGQWELVQPRLDLEAPWHADAIMPASSTQHAAGGIPIASLQYNPAANEVTAQLAIPPAGPLPSFPAIAIVLPHTRPHAR